MIDNKLQNIWQTSQISLCHPLCQTSCLITQKNGKSPKLFILGGTRDMSMSSTNECYEYNLCDIIGYHTFYRFFIDLKQVTYHP